MPLSDEMKAEGWIEHYGGPCPVQGFGVVEVLTAGGWIASVSTQYRGWELDAKSTNQYRIIAYKPEPRP